MIITKWFKNKIMEIEMKYAFYSTIMEFAKEHEDITKLIKNLYTSLKDVPAEDLRKEFIHALAEIIHKEKENLMNGEGVTIK